MIDFPLRKPNNILTVIIRDDTPMLMAGDSPSYRSVRVSLTNEQLNKIKLKCTGINCGNPIYEEISKCFIEPLEEEIDES